MKAETIKLAIEALEEKLEGDTFMGGPTQAEIAAIREAIADLQATPSVPVPTPHEFAEKMRKIDHDEDAENGHIKADALLMETLRALGYEEGVEIFENMTKWYA